MKKIIVAGGRDFTDRDRIRNICRIYFCNSWLNAADVLISGGCRGADALAQEWAENSGFDFILHPADWDKHGRAAGPIRNRQMAQDGNMLIAFWDGKSRGTKNMIEEALKAGLEVHVYRYGS